MPLSKEHKAKSRKKIVECARILFNVKGLHEVSIDEIMEKAGLTRGGFYSHFKNKDELYAEAVIGFLNGRGKKWRDEAGVDPTSEDDITSVLAMLKSYLSDEHLGDLEGQCPMIALPSDAARAGPKVREAYEQLLRAMVSLFENNCLKSSDRRQTALVLSSLCVGGMVLSRTVENEEFSRELRHAAYQAAHRTVTNNGSLV